MEQARRHPDLFSAEEAMAYLHLDNVATLDTFVKHAWLEYHMAGRQRLYWRRDLDDCALRIVGETPPTRAKRQELRLTGSDQ